MDVEGIGKAHEEVEKGAVVDRLGNLTVGPPDLTEPLDLLVGDAVSVPGQRLDEFQEEPVPRCQVSGVEVAIA